VLRPHKQREEVRPSSAYVQPPQHLQQPQRAPVATAPAAPNVRYAHEPQPAQVKEVVKSSFSFAKLIAAGKLLVPAAQAIISAVQDHQAKQQAGK